MDFPILLIIIIALALIFDFINGFHDAANSIATIVSTKVLTPFQAVLWAAVWNFAAFFTALYIIGEFRIGNTIAKSVNEDFINLEVILQVLLLLSSGIYYLVVWDSFFIITYFDWWFYGSCSYACFLYAISIGKWCTPDAGLMNNIIQAFKNLLTRCGKIRKSNSYIFIHIFGSNYWYDYFGNHYFNYCFYQQKICPHKADRVLKNYSYFHLLYSV
jgi:PiT family inorganic phosphate transporter